MLLVLTCDTLQDQCTSCSLNAQQQAGKLPGRRAVRWVVEAPQYCQALTGHSSRPKMSVACQQELALTVGILVRRQSAHYLTHTRRLQQDLRGCLARLRRSKAGDNDDHIAAQAALVCAFIMALH